MYILTTLHYYKLYQRTCLKWTYIMSVLHVNNNGIEFRFRLEIFLIRLPENIANALHLKLNTVTRDKCVNPTRSFHQANRLVQRLYSKLLISIDCSEELFNPPPLPVLRSKLAGFRRHRFTTCRMPSRT